MSRLPRRIALATVTVIALACTVVSIGQLQDLDERQQQASAATVSARSDEAALIARAADTEALILQLDLARDDHRLTAGFIDDAVADIVHLRTKVDTLRAAVEASRSDRDARQQRMAVLLGCRDTLSAAVAQLAGGHVTAAGAIGVLDQGRAQCQAALDLIQGGTGAVHPYDFADPSVLRVGSTYYAYATEGPGGAIQVLSSKDLTSWSVRTRALANRPAWAKPGPIWAPTVQPIGGRYLLFYATRSKISGQQCISSAAAADPAGPYLDDSTVPMVCQDDLGGSIDPDVYLDGLGFAHLTWKSEDETTGGAARIWTQPLGKDGRSVVGLPTELLRAEQPWEAKTIENPSMVQVDGTWILLYSGNRWSTGSYAVGYAVCESATGPCRRPASPRLRISGATFEGPGGADAFTTTGGRTAVAYAAWDRGRVGPPNPRRLHLATISYRNGVLSWREF